MGALRVIIRHYFFNPSHILHEDFSFSKQRATHLRHHAVVSYLEAVEGWSLLHCLCDSGDVAAVYAQLHEGADPLLKDSCGKTAVDIAVSNVETAQRINTAEVIQRAARPWYVGNHWLYPQSFRNGVAFVMYIFEIIEMTNSESPSAIPTDLWHTIIAFIPRSWGFV